ncbi:MAG TPA: DUF6364 family protein [Ferruginibacter sp.]|nr:DUF6364 family protein [Ferruginibacter sp.]HRN91631.1 DUF6364 family protein [Ferruginibacter sp.]HRO07171.1 DUF6364 family protein [Ferruginibacter sp.]HRO97585.1 DUF6364 family protein [Ferruginibacter sp.]HRP50610.1 DUF6364 family protein [Ferruginibacter sp.]
MSTKLTLTVEKDVIERAKVYANKKGRSLSDLVENFLRSLVHKEADSDELSPNVKKLLGSVKVPKNFDYKKELSEAINKKYSK